MIRPALYGAVAGVICGSWEVIGPNQDPETTNRNLLFFAVPIGAVAGFLAGCVISLACGKILKLLVGKREPLKFDYYLISVLAAGVSMVTSSYALSGSDVGYLWMPTVITGGLAFWSIFKETKKAK